ncbi:Zinc/iron permease [Blyttiomyces helicus]|uniref:Zinc/iron permease n=1 Tax=Blyttiomyces helicus TaxID=388810 RepID=A0A4P9W001_9FUNG|nr:Zinc/iron permease [Blyttiomyces helicus]|eukprot:RKO84393.1 Zinc/iron permease [Blyttiomyces helicus]
MNPLIEIFIALGLSTLLPFLLIFAIPADLPRTVQTILTGCAVGAALGDVFLHVVPEALIDVCGRGGEECDPHQRMVQFGMVVIAGIVCFSLVEKVTDAIVPDHHHHDHPQHEEETQQVPDHRNYHISGTGLTRRASADAHETSRPEREKTHDRGIALARGLLQMAASLTYCFADGAALALAFSTSSRAGYSAAFAVFTHELPHKLSGYSLLRRSGHTKTAALRLQFLSVVASYAGALSCHLMVSESPEGGGYMAPFTAGGLAG